MKRHIFAVLLGLFAVLSLAPLAPAQNATVSGDLSTIFHEQLQGDAFVRVRLRNYSGCVPRISGGGGIITETTKEVSPDGTGHFSTTLVRNDFVDVCGVTSRTFYSVEYWNNGVAKSSANYQCLSATCDLNTLATFNPQPPPANILNAVLTNPSGTQTVSQPIGSSLLVNRFENLSVADQFSSTQAAFTDAGTTGGILIPPNYTIGAFTNPNSRPVINFTRFDWRGFYLASDSGAVGDTSTDDTFTLQSWINSVGTAQGEGWLPCGTYKITSQLNVAGTGRFTLHGTGDCSIIQFDGSTVPIALGSPDTTQRPLIRIDGIKFNSSTIGSGLAIDASHWTQSSIEHVDAFGVNKCILFGNVHALYDEVFKLRCSVTGAGAYGVKFDSVANENSITKARIITDANATGVIVNSQGVKLYDVDVETGALVGIDVQASARTTLISGAWLEANQTNLKLAAGAQGTTVIASEIDSGSVADITDNGATGTILCGVRKTFVMQPCTLGSGMTANLQATIDSPAGTNRQLSFSTAGISRWITRVDSVAETGSNVGSDWNLLARDDSGAALFTAIKCIRSTGQCLMPQGLVSGPFISNSSANVPVNGILRMAKTDTIKFRNNANSADITALSMNLSDVVQVGAAAGMNINGSQAITGVQGTTGAKLVAATGSFTSGNPTKTDSNGNLIDAGMPFAYTFSSANKRWELFDSTIPTWLIDANPGFKLDIAFSFGEPAASAIIGGLKWTRAGVGTPASSLALSGYRLTTSAAASDTTVLTTQANGIEAQNIQSFLTTFAMPATTSLDLRLGYGDASAFTPPTNGIYLEALNADTDWFLVTMNTSVQTRCDTTVSKGTAAQSFVVTVTTSSVSAFIPGTASVKCTNSTNIPATTTLLGPIFGVRTQTTAAKSLDLYQFMTVGIQKGY